MRTRVSLSDLAPSADLSDKEYAQEASYRYGKTTYSPGAPRTVYIGLHYQW